MKKLFRRSELKAPAYPTREALVNGRAIAVASLLAAAATSGGCLIAGIGPDEAASHSRDAGAGRDAEFTVPPGGAPVLPDEADAGVVALSTDAGQ